MKRATYVWTKPKREMVKVSFNAAIDAEIGRVGIGVSMRDCMGDILACLCANERLLKSPLVAEVVALRRAIIYHVHGLFRRCYP